jgi:tetratricopeptide (TPR) repeat protein
MPMRTMPSTDGSFEFRGVPEGTYTVRVTTLNGDLICERYEHLHHFGDPLTIRIPKRKQPEPVSGTVSYAELKDPPPKKARRALEKAQQFTDSRKLEKARRSLEEAIRLYPRYMEAYANLGVLLIRTGRKEEAVQAFEKALSIGPESAMLQTNYAYALRATDRRPEALKAARRAVDLDAGYLKGHYLLGSILAEKRESSEQAAPHLAKASAGVPEAHLHLAQIKARAGDRAGAIFELEQYRSYATAPQRAQIDHWVKALRQK